MADSNGPVNILESDHGKPLEQGIGLCLSGGGYRAMLFHLGSLLRLIELRIVSDSEFSSELGNLSRISSVSGGSITSAALGQSWSEVKPGSGGARERYLLSVVGPVRNLASKTIDVKSVLGGGLPFTSAADRIASYYRKYLFSKKTLDAFPESPRFVINATNLQSGALWRFMRPYTRDWKVGEIPRERKTIEIALAVSASSAFPPFLSPARPKFRSEDFEDNTGYLQQPPFTTRPVLSDGGVYDNLGLETVWKKYQTVLVSDAGGQLKPQSKVATFWPTQAYRVLNTIDNQVRSLRKRQVIDSFVNKSRSGAYWGIRSDIDNYGLADSLPCPHRKTLLLANVSTRLKALPDSIQEQLINWGYAITDAAIRRHVDSTLPAPTDFPYPNEGVG